MESVSHHGRVPLDRTTPPARRQAPFLTHHPVSHPSLLSNLRALREETGTDLEQRVACDDLEEPLEALPPLVNHVLGEPVRKHLARKRRNVDLIGPGEGGG